MCGWGQPPLQPKTQCPLPDVVLPVTYSAVKAVTASVFLAILGLTARASFAGDYNSLILEQIKQMPQGGRYSVSHYAKIRLQSSAHFEFLRRIQIGECKLLITPFPDEELSRATASMETFHSKN